MTMQVGYRSCLTGGNRDRWN